MHNCFLIFSENTGHTCWCNCTGYSYFSLAASDRSWKRHITSSHYNANQCTYKQPVFNLFIWKLMYLLQCSHASRCNSWGTCSWSCDNTSHGSIIFHNSKSHCCRKRNRTSWNRLFFLHCLHQHFSIFSTGKSIEQLMLFLSFFHRFFHQKPLFMHSVTNYFFRKSGS